ncbi:hypothetical protein C8R44DRAFT_892694 [Mycena epipterygia]|nr:hypothetical protein C8R44DRAFT_892694 [Mycena epipterygia]
MAGFLRKKRQDSAPPPSAIRSASPPVNNAPPPLFARFATSTAETPSQRVVSSPMTLASGPRREQTPRMSTGGGVRGGVQQQREDAKQTRYTVEPSYVQANRPDPSSSAAASASNGHAHSYGSPPPARTQTLPATTTTPNPRRFSHVPGADKPLPTIYPQDNHPDPLRSIPPQSSLPANRRASTRGFPPQSSTAIQNPSNGRVMAVPAQPPHTSFSTRPAGNASPRLGTRTLAPSSSQTPAKPTSGSFQNPSRYPKEYGGQDDPRHKLSDADTASGSGGSPAIPVPASRPGQNAPGQWAPDARAPFGVSASYQVNIFLSFSLLYLAERLCLDPVIAS